jgi:hypothetical protein
MTYLDQHTQDQITDLVEACAWYWALRGVALERCQEMRLELEEHFVQAALDGKAPEVVTGPNPAAFAESWAREMRPRVWRGWSTIMPSLAYALGVVSTTALIQQLLTHTPSFTLTLFTAYALLSSVLLVLLTPLGGFLAPRLGTRGRRGLLLFTAGALLVLILRETGMRINWSMALLNWDWPLTLILLILTAFMFSLHVWLTVKRGQCCSAAVKVPPERSVLLFVARVAMFDVLIFVGSVVVFNSCLLASRLP